MLNLLFVYISYHLSSTLNVSKYCAYNAQTSFKKTSHFFVKLWWSGLLNKSLSDNQAQFVFERLSWMESVPSKSIIVTQS